MATLFQFPAFEAFRPADPEDIVYLTDIEGSTRTIQKTGSYKALSFLATAGLVVAENIAGAVPSVFTGDGCAVVVPPTHDRAIGLGLVSLSNWAKANLGMGLRVARFPVRALTAPLLIATETRPCSKQWHFLGGALQEADRQSKHRAFRHADQEAGAAPDLTGLSCRWNPLSAQRERLVSILIQPRTDAPQAAHAILRRICLDIMETAAPSEAIWPVRPAAMSYGWPPQSIAIEAAARAPAPGLRRHLSVLAILAETLFHFGFFTLFDGRTARTYRTDMAANTMALQIADGMAMMIDCTADQHDALCRHLDGRLSDGTVFYGTCGSDQAHMACVVRSLQEHHHHLDLTVGGYWQASQQLKAQMRTA